MTGDRIVVLELSVLEAAHLAGLIRQFTQLLEEAAPSSSEGPGDPALARLVPDAYPGDRDASRSFREVTESDLLQRRTDDARSVLTSLGPDVSIVNTIVNTGEEVDDVEEEGEDAAQHRTVDVMLDSEGLRAWMRTLAALRLVLASRLGIESEDDHDEDDPRFGIYDWLGYRLDGLVRAASTSAPDD